MPENQFITGFLGFFAFSHFSSLLICSTHKLPKSDSDLVQQIHHISASILKLSTLVPGLMPLLA